MGKRFLVCLSAVVSLMFCSCIDVAQTVDYSEGKYKIGYRLSVNRMLYVMAGEDPEKIFDITESPKLFKGMAFERIDTDIDIGLAFTGEIDPKIDTDQISFLPKVLKNNRIEIPLIGADEIFGELTKTDYTNSDSQAVAKAMLSSAKWRVFITKKLLPSITKVYLENAKGQTNMEFFQVGDVYVINIPVILLEKGIKLVVEK